MKSFTPSKISFLIITLALVVSFGVTVSAQSPTTSDALGAIVSPLERLIQAIQTFLTGESSVAQTTTGNQTNIPAGHKGYYPRACGFDMDDDGIIGEPGDDCNVCDGVTTDVDRDGIDEDLIYVDCNSGSDGNSGSPSAPKRTISGALASVDGPGDGREDIVCVRATCAAYTSSQVSNIGVNRSGVSGIKTVRASGNEGTDFQYPSNPFMIVGWDTDNDGQYPPYDTDQPEPAVIDACASAGCSAGTAANIAFDLSGDHRLEIAHMSIQNYGRNTNGASAGGFRWNAETTHNYIHDLAISGFASRASDSTDGTAIFRPYSPGLSYLAVENINILRHGSMYLHRGGSTPPKYGDHMRYKNLTMEADTGSTGAWPPTIRAWGWKYFEMLNSKFDLSNLSATQLREADEFGHITMSRGASDVFIRGNEWIDASRALLLHGTWSVETGDKHPFRNIFFQRNIVRFTQPTENLADIVTLMPNAYDGAERTECSANYSDPCSACANDPSGANVQKNCACSDASGDGHPTFRDVVVSDNAINGANNQNLGSVVTYQNGNNCSADTIFGPFTFNNNTIFNWNPSAGAQRAVLLLGQVRYGGTDNRYAGGDVRIYNNIFSGLNDDYVVINEKRGDDGLGPISGPNYYGQGDFFADRNIYRGSGVKFRRGGSTYSSLASWRSATGEDINSKDSCIPSFGNDGYSLLSADTCAKDKGNAANCSARDIGGVSRPQGSACDIGADEVGGTIEEPVSYACSDGRDNDVPADGLIDYPADPGCTSATDNDEYNVPVTSTTTCDTTYPSNSFRVCYFDGISAPTTAVTTLATAIETTVPSPVGTWSGFSKSWGTGVVTPTTLSNNVSAVWRGRINFSAGTYTFTTQSDDGVELTIQNVNGGAPIISNWTTHANTTDTSAPITLAAGQYNVQLRYHENTGSANIGLSWTKTTPPVTGAQCGNGIDDEDTEDTLIDMNDPGCGISTDTDESNPTPISRFSNGTRVAVSTSVANIRPYAGDNTSPSPQQPQGALGTVTAGPKWGILNGNGFWYWQVNFDSGTDGWAGDNNLTAAPVVTLPACQDGTDNDGDGLIDSADYGCVTDTDTDEANPSPSTKFTAGTNIVVSGIEGTNVRAYAGGPVVSGVGQPSGATGTVVGGPKYAIFNGTGIWWWQIDYTNAPDGWSGEPLLSAVVAPTYACSNGRDDDSDGKTDAQDVGCINDTDTSESNPTPVTTKFTVGANITVSGTGGVNVREYPGGPTAGTGQAYQATGRVVAGPKYATLNGNPVWWWQIDYTSGTDGWSGENLLSLAAVSSNTCNTAFPTDKFYVCYFDGITAPTTASTVLAQTDETTVPSLVGTWSGFSKSWGTGVVTPTTLSNNVSAVWRGRINFSAGTYTFTTQSDDGVELVIQGVNGGQPLIANWTIHANTTNSSQPIPLAAGQYNVQLRYHENTGSANIGLSWTKATSQTPAACADGNDNDGDGKTDYGTGTNNDPGCTSATDNDEYNLPVNNAVTCSPSSQSTYTNASVSFTATGGNGSFSWSASGGSPSTGSGANFSTTYSSTGAKTVTVTSNGMSDSCGVSVSTPPIQPTSTTQGYQSRACSFDLDFDGVRGEPEDCNEICRAPVDGAGNVNVSIETYREEIYVDTVNGVDGTSCGLNGRKPCKTIARAWNDIAANGSSAKADVVCFAGTERNLSDYAPKSNGLAAVNGAEATYTVPKRGNEVRDFKYAKYPTMLVGWDKDRDGKYPPNDTDDVAVIDGAGKPIAFDLMVNKNQYIELAHFKAINFGQNYDTSNSTGTIKGFAIMNENGTDATRYKCAYRSIHDIELENINSRIETHDSRRVFSFMGSCPIQYTSIENIQCKYCGGWNMRGGWGQDVAGVTKGPLRVKNMTLRVLASPGGSNTRGGSIGIKFWGSKNVEILDNILDGGSIASPGFSEMWTPQSDSTLTGIFASGGSENWDVINNKILNFKTGFNVASYHIQETYRGHGDKVNISRNQIINNYAGIADDFVCIRQTLAVGDSQNNYGDPNVLDIKEDPPHNQGTNNAYMGDISFHSNVCYSPEMSACIFDGIGNINNDIPNDPGTNRYLNNVCRAPGGARYGFVMLGFPWGAGTPEHYQTRYVVKNNIFSSDVGSNAIRVSPELAPKLSVFDVNNNVYAIGANNTGARFIWGNNASTDLAGWRNTTERPDANAKQCEPSFQSQSNNNFHLQSSDTCAMNSGVAYVNFTPMYDMDGQSYGTDGRWDIGADEYR